MDFETIYNQYFGPICHFLVRKLRNPHDAEDIAQETFIAFYKQYSHKEEFDNLEGLLFQIASNKANTFLRNDRWNPLSLEDFKDLPEPEDVFFPLRMDVNQAIARLPKKQQLVINAHYFGGYTFEEMADMFGWTLEQVKYQHRKAKENLCHSLRDYRKELL